MRRLKIAVYGHGGSQNHGNEAIVRGVREIFPDADMKLYTFSVEADKHFGLDEVCEVRPMTQSMNRYYFLRGINKLGKLLTGNASKFLKEKYYREFFRPFIEEIDPDTVYLLEAGDQYCEPGAHRLFYAMLNREIKSRGAKSVMLGCTVDPHLLKDKNMIEDIRRYSLVIARESITFNALREQIKENLHLAPCPAFAMKSESYDVPSWICNSSVGGGVIGFNTGFLQQGNEVYYDILMRNYENAINDVLTKTDFSIALIPHVNWNYSAADFTALDELHRKFKDNPRVHYIEEHGAQQQKYIISKLKAFVVTRTHAAIAALGSNVPVVITGYKTKSRGIAADIFQGNFDVTADVQSLSSEHDVSDKLFGVLENEERIRKFYAERMPEYLTGHESIRKLILSL